MTSTVRVTADEKTAKAISFFVESYARKHEAEKEMRLWERLIIPEADRIDREESQKRGVFVPNVVLDNKVRVTFSTKWSAVDMAGFSRMAEVIGTEYMSLFRRQLSIEVANPAPDFVEALTALCKQYSLVANVKENYVTTTKFHERVVLDSAFRSRVQKAVELELLKNTKPTVVPTKE